MDNLSELFVEAGTLMLAGMVFVFAFLGILILFINGVLAKLAIRYPDPVVVTSNRVTKKSIKKNQDQGVSPQIVAAISSAVHKYRQQHNKEG